MNQHFYQMNTKQKMGPINVLIQNVLQHNSQNALRPRTAKD